MFTTCAPMSWEHYATYRFSIPFTKKEICNIMSTGVFCIHKPYFLMLDHIYVHNYVRTYVATYVCMYVCTFILEFAF